MVDPLVNRLPNIPPGATAGAGLEAMLVGPLANRLPFAGPWTLAGTVVEVAVPFVLVAGVGATPTPFVWPDESFDVDLKTLEAGFELAGAEEGLNGSGAGLEP